MRNFSLRAVFFLLLFAGTSRAQSVAYYPFSSILAVSTNPETALWFDLRFQTNSFFSSLSTEFAPAVNLNSNPRGRFYLGGGVRANFLAHLADASVMEGYFFNAGVRSAPIEKIPQLQFAFEMSPFAARDFESGIFRTRLGVAYNFSHKK
jgi:hypothetical protein